jgi:cobalt/nickel transport system ATP-binding protein
MPMNDAALEVRDLRYAYPDGTAALNGVTFTISPGETVGLIGANGAGKSTLLLHLNGLLFGHGEVHVFGMQVNRRNLHRIRHHVGFVFQNPDDQLFCPTLFEDVAFGPRNMGLPESQVKERVTEALEKAGLAGFEQKNGFHLSLGQKKRAALATVLSMRPELLILDEPTSNLDPRGRRELLALLANTGATKLIATHDLDLVRRTCGRVLFVHRGRLVADGEPGTILADAAFLEANGL